MDLSSIPKSESPSKLLTPWWDVGIYYAATAMLVLSVAAIGLQTTKDGLVCIPAVDCGAAFERNQSVRNGNASYDALNVCSKLKLPGKKRPSGTVVLMTMEDRRQYDYVDYECYAQIPTFPLYFSLIFFGETLLLLFISNFWLKFTKTSCTLNHFENLLSEFNHFERQAYEDLVYDPQLNDCNTDELRIKVNIFNRKLVYFKKQYEGTEYSHKSFFSLTCQYRLRFAFAIIFSVAFLFLNTTLYSQHSIFSQCRLAKALFLKGHEHFECTRPITNHYRVMAWSFSGLLVLNLIFFIRAGYWAFKELGWKPVYEREIVPRFPFHKETFPGFPFHILASGNINSVTLSGDLAFLIKLLENSSASFQNMIDVGNMLNIMEYGRQLENVSQQLGGANDDNVSWESSV